MLKNRFVFLLVLIVICCINATVAYAAKKPLTPEQEALKKKLKEERMKKSEAADKMIRHITPDEFKQTVLGDKENLWVVFYGSKTCPHTQKFNPKWLQFQDNMDNGIYNLDNVKIAKIECKGNNFKFCVSQDNQYWPELMFYFKGEKKAAYDGEDEIEDVVGYIRRNKDKFMGIKSAKTLPSKKPAKQIQQENTKRPVKQIPSAKQPPAAYKASKQPPNVKIDDSQDNVPNFKSSENNDDDFDNIEEKEVEEAIEDNYDNGSTTVYFNDNTLEDAPGSHFIVYTLGGCAVCIGGFLFAKKRFRGGHKYSRVGGNERRSSQMKYKYDKHIV